MKRILMILTVALVMSTFLLPEAFAAPQRYDCNYTDGVLTTIATVVNKGQAMQYEKQYGDICQPFTPPG